MIILLAFAFLSGLATLLAPCIWPILPIVLSVGITGRRGRTFGVIIGLAISFTIATLLLSSLLRTLPITTEDLRLVAASIIVFFGLSLVIPSLSRFMERCISRIASMGGKGAGSSGANFLGGFIAGVALGLLWSPCAGPILATVATVAATQALTFEIVLITAAFIIGVVTPLFLLALFGRFLVARMKGLSPFLPRLRQLFGVIVILAGVALFTGYDQLFQAKVVETYPVCGPYMNSVEGNSLLQEKLLELRQGATR